MPYDDKQDLTWSVDARPEHSELPVVVAWDPRQPTMTVRFITEADVRLLTNRARLSILEPLRARVAAGLEASPSCQRYRSLLAEHAAAMTEVRTQEDRQSHLASLRRAAVAGEVEGIGQRVANLSRELTGASQAVVDAQAVAESLSVLCRDARQPAEEELRRLLTDALAATRGSIYRRRAALWGQLSPELQGFLRDLLQCELETVEVHDNARLAAAAGGLLPPPPAPAASPDLGSPQAVGPGAPATESAATH